jgi:WD40 repeat protein
MRTTRWHIAALAAALSAWMAAQAAIAAAPATAPAGPAASQPALPEKALVRFGEARLFHGSHIKCLAFTPDGLELLAAGGQYGQGGNVSVWDVRTGALVRSIEGPENGVAAMSISRDGNSAVLAGLDRTVRVVSLVEGKPATPTQAGSAAGNWAALSPDSSRLAVSEGMRLSVIDLPSGKKLLTVEKGSSGGFSPDGRYLVVASTHSTTFGIELWDIASATRIRKFDGTDNQRFSVPVFSPDGRSVAAGNYFGGPREVVVWQAATGRVSRKLPLSGSSMSNVAFSPDGRILACTDSSSSVRLWDMDTGKSLPSLTTGDWLYTVAFSPDGRRLAAAGYVGRIRLWNTDGFAELLAPAGHGGPVTDAAASADGRIVATGGTDGTVLLWDGRTGRQLRRLAAEENGASAVAVSQDGALAASCGNAEAVHIWRTDTGKLFRNVRSGLGTTVWLTFLPGRRELIALGESGASCRIDADTGKVAALAAGTAGPVQRIAVSDDGYEAAKCDRSAISTWALRGGRKLGSYTLGGSSYIYGLALGPSGRLIAGDVGQGLMIMELDSGQVVREIQFTRRRVGNNRMAFSPDGLVLAHADFDGRITLWSVRTGQGLGQRLGHRGPITAMSFMQDGKGLLTGSIDGTAMIWDVSDLAAFDAPTTAPRKGPQGPVKRDDLVKAWEDLAGEDARQADAAYYRLAAAGDEAVGVLAESLAAVEGPDAAAIDKLVADLGDQRYGVRKQATDTLAKLGPLAEPALRRAKDSAAIEEVRMRARQLLASMDDPQQRAGGPLRQLRAALVLERIGSAKAVAVLRRLAAGSPGANLTRRAAEALERIEGRAAARKPKQSD